MEEVAFAYDAYMSAYEELIKSQRKSEAVVMKGLLSLRLTERDEARFTLSETPRLAISCVRIDVDENGVSTLRQDIKSTLVAEKTLETTSQERNGDKLRNRKDGKLSKGVVEATQEEANVPKVVDPAKLVHGGFNSLSMKVAQAESRVTVTKIINVINLRNKVMRLLEECQVDNHQ